MFKHLFFYKPNIFVAILKYTNNDIASTNVVMNGPAITVGSNPNFLAKIGKKAPIDLAAHTVTNKDKLITIAINYKNKKLIATQNQLYQLTLIYQS